MQLRKFGVKIQRIDHILVSHLHGDHYFGLVGLLSTMHLLGRERSVTIYGPKGIKDIVDIQLKASGGVFSYDVIFHEIDPETTAVLFEDEKIIVSCFPLSHKIPTSGFKITQKEKERRLLIEKAKSDGVKIEHYHKLKKGLDVQDDGRLISYEEYTESAGEERSYAYCSDTEYLDSTVDHVSGVDVLYHEATFVEHLRDRAVATKHSTAKDAAIIAKKAGVSRLLMGHLSARYDSGELHLKEAQKEFQLSEVVEDGNVYSID
jgi:ribonuclease Z